MNPVFLSIIIPAYMEAIRIGDTLVELAKFLDSRSYGEVEVLVVIADSPDQTAQIARSHAHLFKNFRVIDAGPKVGKGRDVRLGLYEAQGAYKLFMDADLATPLKYIDNAYAWAQAGGQIGIAVRNLSTIHDGILRKTMSIGGNLLAQVVLLPGLTDTQCGFKIFSAKAAEDTFSRMLITGWGFDMEVLAIGRRLGYRIDSIEVPDWHDPKSDEEGFTGESAIQAALQVFRDLFKVRINIWRGKYKKPSYTKS